MKDVGFHHTGYVCVSFAGEKVKSSQFTSERRMETGGLAATDRYE